MFRRLIAAVTLCVVVAGTLIPATAAAHARGMGHCLPAPGASISAASGMDCDGATGMTCSASGCIAAPVAIVIGSSNEVVTLAAHAAVLPSIAAFSDRLSAGPPTPPPNR